MDLLVKKLVASATLPTKAFSNDAGFDLYYSSDSYELDYSNDVSGREITIFPNSTIKFPTGISVGIPNGYFGLIKDRSSLGSKGIHVLGGVIDAQYRGEIMVLLVNLGKDTYTIHENDKIAQLIILPVPNMVIRELKELPNTLRQSQGFGSTGR